MSQVMDRVSELRGALAGDVFVPGDEGFDEAKSAWNLTIQHQPAMVAVVASEADVEAAVRFANRHDLPIAVQATGHGQPRPCVGGLLVIMSKLNGVHVDAQAQTARIEGGAQWQDVFAKTTPAGLVPISGSSPTVGVVGYTLGGGLGLLSRKYGLAVDSVLSFRLVTPAGDLLEVTPESHGELFWAVMGGGGAYGVLTEITMRLYAHAELFGGSVMFDASLASHIYPAYLNWTRTLPDDVSAAILMMNFPPIPAIPPFLQGRQMVIVAGTALTDLAQAQELWAPIRSLPGAEFDSFGMMTYDQSGRIFNEPEDPMPLHSRGIMFSDLDEDALKALLEAIGEPGRSPNLLIQIRHLEGAIIERNLGQNAVSDRRRAKYVLHMLGVPMGPATPEAMKAHAETAFEALKPWTLARGLLNWIGEGDVKREHVNDVYHTEELARLEAVKRSVDPENRFRYAGVGLD